MSTPIGIRPLEPRALARWRFDEQHDSVTPSDETGTLGELEAGAGIARPAVVEAIDGFGRGFTAAPATGLEVADAGDDLDAVADLSIVAILSVDTVAMGDLAIGTIISRSKGDGTLSFRLSVSVGADAGAHQVTLLIDWVDAGGASQGHESAVIPWTPGDEKVIGVVLEQEAGGAQVRYIVDGKLVDSATGFTAGAGSVTGANVYLGCDTNGLGGHRFHLDGVISYLEVLAEAVTLEELEMLWLARAVDQARALPALRALLPPGAYTDDPESFVQRWYAAEADGMASVRNEARLLLDYLLPGRAFGERLADWEKISGRPRYPSDTIADRRARVESYLKRAPGYNTADLRFQLAELLGYEADPTLADILTYSVDRTEDFSTASSPGADSAVIDHGNAAWTVAAGVLELDAAAQDLRFDPVSNGAPYHLFSFTASRDTFFGGTVTRNADPTALDVLAGFTVGSRQSNDWLWVGLGYTGASHAVISGRFVDGEMDAAFTLHEVIADATVHFRFRHRGAGKYDVQWGNSDAAAQSQTPTEIDGPSEPLWAGFGAVAIAASVSVDFSFDDWYSHEVEGTAPVTYHVFRDPVDGGEYDVEGAHRLLQQIGPAHFEGYVIDQAQLTCDDTDTGCDRQPMGV